MIKKHWEQIEKEKKSQNNETNHRVILFPIQTYQKNQIQRGTNKLDALGQIIIEFKCKGNKKIIIMVKIELMDNELIFVKVRMNKITILCTLFK